MNLMSVPELEPQTSCVTAETVHTTRISKLYKQCDFQTSDHTREAKCLPRFFPRIKYIRQLILACHLTLRRF